MCAMLPVLNLWQMHSPVMCPVRALVVVLDV